MKSCSTAFDIFRSDMAAVSFDNGTNNCQPHPQSTSLSSEKLFEKSLPRFLLNANAIVPDTDTNRPIAVEAPLQLKIAPLSKIVFCL